MVEYRKLRKEEADDLLDFINYVFSESRCPHDFRKVIPDLYDSDYPFWNDHFVVVEDGHIRATVALTCMKEQENNQTYLHGHIGQVSVHPYHRRKNYMRILMGMAIEEMKEKGIDYCTLNGQRQRYQYFGFEPANYKYLFKIDATNIRHVMKGRKPGIHLQKEKSGYSAWLNQKRVGFVDENELVIEEHLLTADAIGAYFEKTGKKDLSLEVRLYDVNWAENLSRICESVTVIPKSQVRIFNFRRFMENGLRKRAQVGLCEDGQVTLQVDEDRFGLWVKDGQVGSFDINEAEYVFEPFELQRLILSLTASAADGRFPHGWFPISL